ncbi:MAG: glutamine--tRNA ligase/YqeY domain fusion protein [Candidatus Hodarchaeales archaeon]
MVNPNKSYDNEENTDKDDSKSGVDFIRKIVIEDIENNRNEGRIHTRFPPEPNGYVHIGHAKAINLNFSIAEEYNGLFNLRFDDTDPQKEKMEYVDATIKDIKWLGVDWEDRLYFASDYFEQLYEMAIALIKAGKAFVCDLSANEITEQRGTLTEPGKNSPYRTRSIEENLELFEGMRDGKYEDGSRVLRAKIDMSDPNVLMRDPVLYRIRRVSHYRRGDDWIIYPSYDFTHGQSDAIEKITHSLCSLEFENHRPLYNWFVDELYDLKAIDHKPRQIEFSRLNLTYTVMSKRRLLKLVDGGYVNGWDDPRMPTLSGMRRRGFPSSAVRTFLKRVGISKRENYIDMGLLESCIRDELNNTAPRALAVMNPLKLVITNYPDDQVEEIIASNHPKNEAMGERKLPFSKTLYIEKDDFMEEPPKKFYRLSPGGREVRLRYAYYIKCTEVIKDDKGNILEVRATYDPETKGGYSPDGRKVKSTIHWLSEDEGVKAKARLYERLFLVENPQGGPEEFTDHINPNSLKEVDCFVEPSLKNTEPNSIYQFERLGYFCVDQDSNPEELVFNRTVTLRDSYKVKAKQQQHSKKK